MSVIRHIPRGPFYNIGMFSGGWPRPAENPNGHANWWNVDPASNINLFDSNTGMRLYANSVETAIENLEERIRYGYDAGFRHFFLNRPMGTTGVDHVSAACWETIEETKRLAMAAKLKAISEGLFGEPVDLVPFIGSGMQAPDSLAGWEGPDDPADGFLLGDVSEPDRLAAYNTIIDGWVNQCGAAGFFIDHTSPANERDHFIQLAHSLWNEHGVYVAGEALPSDNSVPDHDSLREIGWIGSSTYFGHPDYTYQTRSYLDIPFDPNRTRVFVWIEGFQDLPENEADVLEVYRHHTALGRFFITNQRFLLPLERARIRALERSSNTRRRRARGRSR